MSFNNFSHELTLFQKIKNYDFILLFCILILGITSIFTMYSTDGGEVLFHTKSHFIKFSIFFPNDDCSIIYQHKILACR